MKKGNSNLRCRILSVVATGAFVFGGGLIVGAETISSDINGMQNVEKIGTILVNGSVEQSNGGTRHPLIFTNTGFTTILKGDNTSTYSVDAIVGMKDSSTVINGKMLSANLVYTSNRITGNPNNKGTEIVINMSEAINLANDDWKGQADNYYVQKNVYERGGLFINGKSTVKLEAPKIFTRYIRNSETSSGTSTDATIKLKGNELVVNRMDKEDKIPNGNVFTLYSTWLNMDVKNVKIGGSYNTYTNASIPAINMVADKGSEFDIKANSFSIDGDVIAKNKSKITIEGKNIIIGGMAKVENGGKVKQALQLHVTDKGTLSGKIDAPSELNYGRIDMAPGSRWTVTGDSKVYALYSAGTVDLAKHGVSLFADAASVAWGKKYKGSTTYIMSTDKDHAGKGVTITFGGDSNVLYAHDPANPTTIYGGDFKTNDGGTVNLITDATGLNTAENANDREKNIVNATLNALANKLIRPSGAQYVMIGEGVTAPKIKKMANIESGRGVYKYTSVDSTPKEELEKSYDNNGEVLVAKGNKKKLKYKDFVKLGGVQVLPEENTTGSPIYGQVFIEAAKVEIAEKGIDVQTNGYINVKAGESFVNKGDMKLKALSKFSAPEITVYGNMELGNQQGVTYKHFEGNGKDMGSIRLGTSIQAHGVNLVVDNAKKITLGTVGDVSVSKSSKTPQHIRIQHTKDFVMDADNKWYKDETGKSAYSGQGYRAFQGYGKIVFEVAEDVDNIMINGRLDFATQSEGKLETDKNMHLYNIFALDEYSKGMSKASAKAENLTIDTEAFAGNGSQLTLEGKNVVLAGLTYHKGGSGKETAKGTISGKYWDDLGFGKDVLLGETGIFAKTGAITAARNGRIGVTIRESGKLQGVVDDAAIYSDRKVEFDKNFDFAKYKDSTYGHITVDLKKDAEWSFNGTSNVDVVKNAGVIEPGNGGVLRINNYSGNGWVVMSSDKNHAAASVTVNNLIRSVKVFYANDKGNPTTIYGGNFVVKNADKKSMLTLRTENVGKNVDEVFKALADKAVYEGAIGAEFVNLKGRLEIAEGITAPSIIKEHIFTFETEKGHGILAEKDPAPKLKPGEPDPGKYQHNIFEKDISSSSYGPNFGEKKPVIYGSEKERVSIYVHGKQDFMDDMYKFDAKGRIIGTPAKGNGQHVEGERYALIRAFGPESRVELWGDNTSVYRVDAVTSLAGGNVIITGKDLTTNLLYTSDGIGFSTDLSKLTIDLSGDLVCHNDNWDEFQRMQGIHYGHSSNLYSRGGMSFNGNADVDIHAKNIRARYLRQAWWHGGAGKDKNYINITADETFELNKLGRAVYMDNGNEDELWVQGGTNGKGGYFQLFNTTMNLKAKDVEIGTSDNSKTQIHRKYPMDDYIDMAIGNGIINVESENYLQHGDIRGIDNSIVSVNVKNDLYVHKVSAGGNSKYRGKISKRPNRVNNSADDKTIVNIKGNNVTLNITHEGEEGLGVPDYMFAAGGSTVNVTAEKNLKILNGWYNKGKDGKWHGVEDQDNAQTTVMAEEGGTLNFTGNSVYIEGTVAVDGNLNVKGRKQGDATLIGEMKVLKGDVAVTDFNDVYTGAITGLQDKASNVAKLTFNNLNNLTIDGGMERLETKYGESYANPEVADSYDALNSIGKTQLTVGVKDTFKAKGLVAFNNAEANMKVKANNTEIYRFGLYNGAQGMIETEKAVFDTDVFILAGGKVKEEKKLSKLELIARNVEVKGSDYHKNDLSRVTFKGINGAIAAGMDAEAKVTILGKGTLKARVLDTLAYDSEHNNFRVVDYVATPEEGYGYDAQDVKKAFGKAWVSLGKDAEWILTGSSAVHNLHMDEASTDLGSVDHKLYMSEFTGKGSIFMSDGEKPKRIRRNISDMNRYGVYVGKLNGDLTIDFAHDAANPTNIKGKDVYLKSVEEGNATISVRTGNEGIQVNDTVEAQKKIRDVMNAMADKVTLENSVSEGGKVKGKAIIAEGLTSQGVEAEMVFGKTRDNLGEVLSNAPLTLRDKLEDETDPRNMDTFIYGPKKTAMIRGSESAMATAMLNWRSDLSTMNQRVGDLRVGNEVGAWAKFTGGKGEYSKNEAKYKNSYRGMEIGYDTNVGEWIVGTSFYYSNGNANYELGGKGDSKLYMLHLSATKLMNDSSYLDITAKGGVTKNNYTVYNDSGHKLVGDYKSNGYGLSVEYGKRITLGNNYIEPQAQLSYGRLASTSYDAISDYSNGMKMRVHQSAMNSLVGRLGLAVGTSIDNSNFYVKAGVLHEFNGNMDSSFSSETAYVSNYDFGDTWGELAVGGTYKFSKIGAFNFESSKSFGGNFSTEWRLDMSLRFNF